MPETVSETFSATGLPHEKIPGPPLSRFGYRGNIARFLSDPLKYLENLYQNYGDVAKMIGGPEPSMIFAFGPKYNQQIFNNTDTFNTIGLTFAGPENSSQRKLRNGLLSMDGETHRQHRTLVNPPFHPQAITAFYPIVVEIVNQLIADWKDRGTVDLWAEMKKLTKLVSARILFGLDNTTMSNEMTSLSATWLDMNFSAAVRFFPYDFPGTAYWRMLRTAEKIERCARQIMNERQKNLSPTAQDVLSILIRKKNEPGTFLKEDVLIGLINLLFDASYETTASSLTWNSFFLTQHPEVTAELYDELESAARGGVPSFECLNDLPHLENVVRESMRMLPPILYNYRLVTKPVELGPYHIEKGSKVAICQYITHRIPEFYPEPNKFNPKRWVTHKNVPYSYIPFGAGPHACIGGAFALMTIKTAISQILLRYRLSLAPGTKVNRKALLVLRPAGGIRVKVHAQDKRFRESKTNVRGNIHEVVDLN